jgi:hypothetical protein
MRRNGPEKEERPLRPVFIPYLKDISEKFEYINNRYIRAVFETKHILRSSLMRTRPESSMKMAHCFWSIP